MESYFELQEGSSHLFILEGGLLRQSRNFHWASSGWLEESFATSKSKAYASASSAYEDVANDDGSGTDYVPGLILQLKVSHVSSRMSANSNIDM